MPLTQFLVILICIGVALYCMNNFLPWMDAKIKKIANIVVVLCTVLWVLDLFGVFGPLSHLRIGR
jgi:hypothetical protein